MLAEAEYRNKERIEKENTDVVSQKNLKSIEFDAREKADRQKIEELRMLILREKEVLEMETLQLLSLEKQYRIQIGEEDPNKKPADAAEASKSAAENNPDLAGSNENLNKTKGDISFKEDKVAPKPKPGAKPGAKPGTKPGSKPGTRAGSKPAAANRPTTAAKPNAGSKPGTQSQAKPAKPSAQPAG